MLYLPTLPSPPLPEKFLLNNISSICTNASLSVAVRRSLSFFDSSFVTQSFKAFPSRPLFLPSDKTALNESIENEYAPSICLSTFSTIKSFSSLPFKPLEAPSIVASSVYLPLIIPL